MNYRHFFAQKNLGVAVALLFSGLAGANNAPLAVDSAAPSVAHEPHRIPFNTTLNTRDLGGYTTKDQRQVKYGLLYRSDSIAHLDAEDLARMKSLNLAVITDFRSVAEQQKDPDRYPEQTPPIDYRLEPMADPAMDIEAFGNKLHDGTLTNDDLTYFLDRRSMVTDPEMRARWSRWLKSLAEPGNLPQLFHCTAGKDRTGMGSAIVLLTLGVPKDRVMEDFLLSNHYWADRIDKMVARVTAISKADLDQQKLRYVMGVSPDSLSDAIAAMEEHYGSIDGFIEEGLGIDSVTRERLKTALLN